MAWYSGLQTTYYLRALSATTTEKSTINTGSLNAVSATGAGGGIAAAPAVAAPVISEIEQADFAQAAPVPLACSIDNPDCEACQ